MYEFQGTAADFMTAHFHIRSHCGYKRACRAVVVAVIRLYRTANENEMTPKMQIRQGYSLFLRSGHFYFINKVVILALIRGLEELARVRGTIRTHSFIKRTIMGRDQTPRVHSEKTPTLFTPPLLSLSSCFM